MYPCCGIGAYDQTLQIAVQQTIAQMNAAPTKGDAGRIMAAQLDTLQGEADLWGWTGPDLARAYGEMNTAYNAWQPPAGNTVPADQAQNDFANQDQQPYQTAPKGGAPTLFKTAPTPWYKNPWVLATSIVAGLVIVGAVVWFVRPARRVPMGVVPIR